MAGKNTSQGRGAPGARRTPALTKALHYLDTLADKNHSYSIKRLADDADVSHVTMWKARRIRSYGATAGQFTVASPERHEDSSNGWQRLKRRIESDLLQGRLPNATELPSAKELCGRYGANYRTLRKALGALVSQGLLDNAGRRYRASMGKSAGPSFRIAVLSLAWYEGPLMLLAEYDQEYVRNLDSEASRRGIQVELLRYREIDNRAIVSDVRGAAEQNLQKRKDIDGFVLPVWTLSGVSSDLLAQLHAAGKPVVIVDEVGGWELPSYLAGSGKTLRLFARSYESASRSVARELMALGHRRFAFFSAFHNDQWSRECLAGFTHAVGSAGGRTSVRPFLLNGTQTTDEYTRAGWDRCSDKPLRKAFAGWKRPAPKLFVKQFEPYFAVSLDQQAWYAEVRCRMEPLFCRALSDTSITCWVAPDNDVGWIAHEFLENARGISLIAFGNSAEIANRRIAAWDFNTAGAANATIEHLLYPDRTLAGQKNGVLDIQGHFIRRDSVRPCS